ncbi:MAG: phosphoribosylaminoimidazolesuccinocarboxamide synthase [SAR202 cluster bacterium]|nr:phosphoribosylaminoimidazolesuccinocarboxamide synthase [SAR202 cluster bacterium]
MPAIKETNLPNLVHRGKVRDTYDIGDGLLLMIATDRISAFDVILPNAIPDKGAVLSQISSFWFGRTSHIVPNHLVALGIDRPGLGLDPELARRAMIVRRAKRVDVECVVRGYIAGAAWVEYRKSGTLFGEPVAAGLREGDRFPRPRFTPTTKAEAGHDLPMTKQEVIDLAGADTARALEETSIAVYEHARAYAEQRGIVIADTKMEFGYIDGELHLIDELLTPDSSRFWDAKGYAPGKSQPNFDKQFVRDWLNAQSWNREPPAPALPDDIVEKTRSRYVEAFTRLTGTTLR